ncbi:hypothetical protein BDQ17DRAFT_1408881 [Cyathus striatus]|nr:hypothetical protein BDQ17DRAFT_1408881 [Cyathus striatus]
MSFHFPPEIEDEIFKLAVISRPYLPADIHLALISKRVRSYIEPILYKTLMIEGKGWGATGRHFDEVKMVKESKFTLALQSKPASFFQRSVKNLLIVNSVTENFLLDILSICTAVEHLGAYFQFATNPDLWKLITSMPLRSFESIELLHPQLDTPHTFQHLTYLSVQGALDQDQLVPKESFKYFPSLTHFAIRVGDCDDDFSMKLKIVMDNFPLLKTLTILLDEYCDWGDQGSDDEIETWLELDRRVEVIDSTGDSIHFGRRGGHCSDEEEEYMDWDYDRYYESTYDDNTDSEFDEDMYDYDDYWPEPEDEY